MESKGDDLHAMVHVLVGPDDPISLVGSRTDGHAELTIGHFHYLFGLDNAHVEVLRQQLPVALANILAGDADEKAANAAAVAEERARAAAQDCAGAAADAVDPELAEAARAASAEAAAAAARAEVLRSELLDAAEAAEKAANNAVVVALTARSPRLPVRAE